MKLECLLIDTEYFEINKKSEFQVEKVIDLAEIRNKIKDLELTDDFYLYYKVYKNNKQIFVNGKYKTELRLLCDICGEEYNTKIENKFSFVLDKTGLTEEQKKEEVDIIFYEERFYDISDNLRENIILNLPFQQKCKADCKGLCTICGKNLNNGDCECDVSDGHPAFVELKENFK